MDRCNLMGDHVCKAVQCSFTTSCPQVMVDVPLNRAALWESLTSVWPSGIRGQRDQNALNLEPTEACNIIDEWSWLGVCFLTARQARVMVGLPFECMGSALQTNAETDSNQDRQSKGAFWALMLAFVTGVIRMILAFVYYSSGGCGKADKRPGILKNFHYMYFSLFITLLTAATAIIISYFTGRPDTKYLVRTTFWTRKSEPYVEEPDPKDSNKDKENGFTNIAATGDNNMQVFSVEEKHVYRDPDLDNPEQEKGLHCAERALNCVCGITAEVDEEKESQLRIHMEKVTTLKQNKYAKIGLNIGLVIILSLGTFLYIF